MPRWRSFPLLLTSLLVVAAAPGALASEGRLATVRDDVHGVPGPPQPAQPTPQPPADQRRRGYDEQDDEDEWTWEDLKIAATLAGIGVAAPVWGPHAVLGDDLSTPGLFPRHPYDHGPAYMLIDGSSGTRIDLPPDGQAYDPALMPEYMHDELLPPTKPRLRRPWSGRIRFEYSDTLADLNRVGGHLLLTTSSRFGLDAEANHFGEVLSGGRRDELWMGDANLVFRFAQSPRWQWRVGLGANWLDDPLDTEFGFNFTYGVDFFPRRPVVLSSTLDWGTLGSASVFHFRTTAGLIVSHVEICTGYEYRDIDRTQFSALIGGVRVWF